MTMKGPVCMSLLSPRTLKLEMRFVNLPTCIFWVMLAVGTSDPPIPSHRMWKVMWCENRSG